MTGRTNANRGGGQVKLIWTNPSPNTIPSTSLTITSPDEAVAFVIDAKRTTSDNPSVIARNFILANTTQTLIGYSGGGNTLNAEIRTVRTTNRQVTITLNPNAYQLNTIPLRVYAIY